MSITYRATDDTLSNTEIDSNFKSVAWRYGGDLASAGTLTFTDEFNYFHITGTTGVTDFADKAYTDSKYGYVVMLEFDGALVITHNAAALVLSTSANITTAAGDVAIFVQETAAIWRLVSYIKANGQSLSATHTPDATFTGDISVGDNAYYASETDVGTVTGDFSVAWASGNVQKVTVNVASAGVTFSTDPAGPCHLTLKVTQGATPWSTVTGWTVTAGGSVLFGSNGADVYAPSAATSDIDILSFYFDGTDYYATSLLDFA